MSFNRLSYDTCTYSHNLKQSIGVGEYMLGVPKSHCGDCFYADPKVRAGMGSAVAKCADRPLVDVDSEMLGLTRRASDCPADQYIPGTGGYDCKLGALKECADGSPIHSEDTRISNPPCTLRGTGWNRWEWLPGCKNPQDDALARFDFNIQNRIVVKDNHRPCLPKPIDQTLALPPFCANDTAKTQESWTAPTTEKANNLPMTHWRTCSQIKQY